MNKTMLAQLAETARPLNDDDWGTERQIAAENAFFDACRATYPELFGDSFERWCLGATSDERITEALVYIALAD